MDMCTILSSAKEVAETTDAKKVAQMLSSGNWIAVCATDEAPYCFCLVRIKDTVEQ